MDETGGFLLLGKDNFTFCLIVSQPRPISLSFFCDLIITLGSGAFPTHSEGMAQIALETLYVTVYSRHYGKSGTNECYDGISPNRIAKKHAGKSKGTLPLGSQ